MIAAVQHSHPASDKLVIQALVPFKLLYDKAIFTQKSIEGLQLDDTDQTEVVKNTQYYQRKLNQERLKEIQKFIVDTILDEKDNNAVATLFPSSMILAVQKVELPQTKEYFDFEFDDTPIYIVDGQHRMMAMKLLYERMTRPEFIQDDDIQYIVHYLENYRFNATILVNYDLWEQGQVFVNVNFRQKPVNKSLYYEVF
jgi:DGQHR domain-containing protein